MESTSVKIGWRIASPVTNLATAGVGAAATVFSIPALAGVLVGTKSAVIKSVTIHNNAAGNTTLIIGTGVAGTFAALLPALDSTNGLTDSYNEDDLADVESFNDITAYPSALAAGGSLDVELELLIRG